MRLSPVAAAEGPHSRRDGLGVGAQRGSGEVAMLMLNDTSC